MKKSSYDSSVGCNDHRWPIARCEVNSVSPGPQAKEGCSLHSYDSFNLSIDLMSPLVNCAAEIFSSLHLSEGILSVWPLLVHNNAGII